MKLWRQTVQSRTPGTGVGQKEHGPQPEYFISALCYSLCAHITQTRLNFCNFSLHSHTHTRTQIHFNVNPFSKDFPTEAPLDLARLIRSHSRLPFGFNHQPQRQQKRLHIFIINAPRLPLQAPQHPQAKPGKPSRASQADSGPDRALNWTASSLFLSLPLPSLCVSLSCCLVLLGSRICWLCFLSRVATTLRWSWTQTLTSSLLST